MNPEVAGRYLKDLLFPVFCAGCSAEGEWWCQSCLEKYGLKAFDFCPVCHKNVSGICDYCKAVSSLDGATAFFVYDEEEPPAKLIKSFKYQFARETKMIWEKIIKAGIADKNILPDKSGWVVMPVPLHARRERERGFNQAKILAQLFSADTGLPLADGLVRTRYTSQQAKSNREDRIQNLSNAFDWTGIRKSPAKIFLIDDVYTTGATMQSCAKTLKNAGADNVWAVVLARG